MPRSILHHHTLLHTRNDPPTHRLPGFDYRWYCSCGSVSSTSRRTEREAREGHLRHYQRMLERGLVVVDTPIYTLKDIWAELSCRGEYHHWKFGVKIDPGMLSGSDAFRRGVMTRVKEDLLNMVSENDPRPHLPQWRIHHVWRDQNQNEWFEVGSLLRAAWFVNYSVLTTPRPNTTLEDIGNVVVLDSYHTTIMEEDWASVITPPTGDGFIPDLVVHADGSWSSWSQDIREGEAEASP